MVNKYRIRRLEKRDKKLLKLQRELMEYEMKTQKLKIIGMGIHYYNNGQTILCNIGADEVLNYILTPIGILEKNIPFNSPKLHENEFDLNEQFYKYRQKLNTIYKDKAKNELEYRENKNSKRWTIVATIGTVISVLIAIIALKYK